MWGPTPCQCPTIRGRGRCRLHGGRSPGAPSGSGNGNYVEPGDSTEWWNRLKAAMGTA
ncbi:HGGxSTG domain-containing protein [Bradyrhizobium canariense]|uniref:HGGxSTG domain-containing protein n=1 Tax=Bradyrhizobium canariense TaxID=255045 RepID=UPI003D9BE782